MIYHRGASLSEQHTDLLCTKQDLSHTSRFVDESSPKIARYCIRMPTARTATLNVTTRAAGSNLRMVRPSLLMSVVKLLIIRAQSARQKFGPWYFLAVRRRSHCTSASNWDSKAWKFSHTERKSYACALRYVPCRILLQQFETTQMSNT